MTTPRGLTQPFTSFIGSACQGIHHAPLITNTQTTTHNKVHAVATQVNLTKKLTKEKRNHTNTHKQTTQSSPSGVLNARVHYTVLTQHPNHTPPTHTVSTRLMVRHTKKGDNAPDTQQCTNIQTTYFYNCARHVYHKAPFKHLDFVS